MHSLKSIPLSERIYSMLNGLYFLGPIYFKGAAEIIVRSYFLKGLILSGDLSFVSFLGLMYFALLNLFGLFAVLASPFSVSSAR